LILPSMAEHCQRFDDRREVLLGHEHVRQSLGVASITE
jgi:hypothetical protein